MRIQALHQLNAIAEGVVDKNSIVTGKRLILRDNATGGGQFGSHGPHIVNQKCRMGLARRTKISLHAEMNLNPPTAEPATAAPCQMSRLLDLRNAEQTLIKRASLGFPSGRHRQQNVIQRL